MPESTMHSARLFEQARHTIPGGVNSPVRAFNGVGGTPRFIARADGAYLYDVDGRGYIDYIGSWGPMLLGHNHPTIKEAVLAAVERGLSYGAPTEIEVRMAETIRSILPSMEMTRMVNSGTEATMSAIRLARGFTGRDKFIKFEGCYHGHADALLVKAGSGALTLGQPNSPGVPADFVKHTLVCDYNNLASVRAAFEQYPQEIACIIVEPVAGNMNCIPPVPGFLEGLRALCDEFGALLIFDEVMTGFRVSLQGAQGFYGITPDLTTLGKIIGGGMPVGAFGGRREIMEYLAPVGPVYQAGTLSGNPLAMTAGIATLRLLMETKGFYDELSQKTATLAQGLYGRAAKYALPVSTCHLGGMFGLFFHAGPVLDYRTAQQADLDAFCTYFHTLLAQGIYVAPSQFEAAFVSAAHSESDLERTLNAAEHAFAAVMAMKDHFQP